MDGVDTVVICREGCMRVAWPAAMPRIFIRHSLLSFALSLSLSLSVCVCWTPRIFLSPRALSISAPCTLRFCRSLGLSPRIPRHRHPRDNPREDVVVDVMECGFCAFRSSVMYWLRQHVGYTVDAGIIIYCL